MARLGTGIAVAFICEVLLTGAAFAENVTLNDLRGFSFDAQLTRLERNKRLNVPDDGWKWSRGVFALQIFVANSGRLFSRQSYSDAYSKLHFDAVSVRDTQKLRFDEKEGFIRINYDAPPNRKSTFAMVTTISVSRDGSGGLVCAVSMTQSLRNGETQYIKPVGTRF